VGNSVMKKESIAMTADLLNKILYGIVYF
jgi:hypothetical protein